MTAQQASDAVRPFCVGCGVDVPPITVAIDRDYAPVVWWPGCPVCDDRALCLPCLYGHKVYHSSRVIVSPTGQ